MEAKYLLLYVDDMLLISKDKVKILKMKGMLRSEFGMEDLGAACRILRMTISRKREKNLLFLNQTTYL